MIGMEGSNYETGAVPWELERQATALALAIQRRDDPAQNRALKELLYPYAAEWIGAHYSDKKLPPALLEHTCLSFLERNCGFLAAPQDRRLSLVYRFLPGGGEDGFCAFVRRSLAWETDIYEPFATELVMRIQAGVEEEQNRRCLMDLLYPFAVALAGKVMGQGRYKTQDIEDAVQELLVEKVFSGREGWQGENHRRYSSYLYQFDPERIGEGGCFLHYFAGVMTLQFRTWYRKMPGGRSRWQARRGDEAGRELSIDAPGRDESGNICRDSAAGIQAAVRRDAAARERWRREMEQRIARWEAAAVTVLFQKYFDCVNGLDEGKKGARTVHERGILAYHLAYAAQELSSQKLLASPEEAGNARDLALAQRPKSFRQAVMAKRNQPLAWVIREQNRDYQLVFQTDKDFLTRLARRVSRQGMDSEGFLLPEHDLNSRVYGWVDTIRRRTRADYQAIVIEGYEKVRREIGNGIQ